mgnify:FL=1
MTMARTLRTKIERGVLVSAPGAANALITARLIEQAGFESVYMTGFGGKAAHLGKPDLQALDYETFAAAVDLRGLQAKASRYEV